MPLGAPFRSINLVDRQHTQTWHLACTVYDVHVVSVMVSEALRIQHVVIAHTSATAVITLERRVSSVVGPA